MADFNPGQVLPGNHERISVNILTQQWAEADEQARSLARKANNIWHKLNPDDDLKTEVYEMKDFLKENHEVFIPNDVEQMFEEYEAKRVKDREEKALSPTKESLKKAVKDSNDIEGSVLKLEQVKKNPVFDKLMASFGLQKDNRPKTITKKINGLDITFEYPSSMISNFALAYATSEGIGNLDFGHSLQLMTVALSVVEIDGSPISTALNIVDTYNSYTEIPARVRKICGVRMVEFLQSISDKDLEKFMTVYDQEIGFDNSDTNINTSEFVEVKCPICGRVEVVSVEEDGSFKNRYCKNDGSIMEVQSSNKTDENAPLA